MVSMVVTACVRYWRNKSFLRGNLRLILFWPVAGTLVACLAWGTLLEQLDAQRRSADAAALKLVAINVDAQAQRIQRSLTMVDEMLAVVKMHWQVLNANIQLNQLKGSEPFYGSKFDIFILDAYGNLKMSTAPRATGPRMSNLQARSFFSAQKSATTDVLFVGYPIQLTPSAPISINYSRRLQDRTGAFTGVAAITVDAGTLVADYDDATLGQRGLLEVIGSDNISRAARVGKQHVPFAMVPERLPGLLRTAGEARFAEGELFVDQRNRYVGWRAVAGYPLFAVVGIDQQDYLGAYLERRSASLHTALGATLALIMLILAATFLSVRLAWKNQQLQHAHTTYRIATEGGDDGFFIIRTRHDRLGNTVDFSVLDCNAKGAAWFGQERTAFIGSTVGEWHNYTEPVALLSLMNEAVRSGKAAGDLDLHDQAGDGATLHLHLKAVRSGDNLALTLQDFTLQRIHLAMLERSSNEDALTGLPNRAWAQRFLGELLQQAALEHEQLALLFIDLDGFKAVNDTLGHAAGDDVLKHASARLKAAIRPHDHLARLGGDEFIVIVRRVKDPADAEHVARRILLSFCKEFSTRYGNAMLGTSIGIAQFPSDAADVDGLLRRADEAMYQVKGHGKNDFAFFANDRARPAAPEALRFRLQSRNRTEPARPPLFPSE